jgi:hypothetical protein
LYKGRHYPRPRVFPTIIRRVDPQPQIGFHLLTTPLSYRPLPFSSFSLSFLACPCGPHPQNLLLSSPCRYFTSPTCSKSPSGLLRMVRLTLFFRLLTLIFDPLSLSPRLIIPVMALLPSILLLLLLPRNNRIHKGAAESPPTFCFAYLRSITWCVPIFLRSHRHLIALLA